MRESVMGVACIPPATVMVMGRISAVEFFSRRVDRVYVNGGAGEVLQAVQEPMVYLLSYLVPLFHRQRLVHRNIHLRQHAMSQPPYPDFGDFLHSIGGVQHATDFIDDLGLDPVQ